MTRLLATLAAVTLGFSLTARAEPALSLAVPPLSLEGGATTLAPFTVFAMDPDTFAPLPGLAVTFSTEADCGTFAGSTSVTAATDGIGRADSPLFTALSSERFCHVFIEVEGRASVIDLPVYEFTADHVVVHVPAEISVPTSQQFQVLATFTADGVPIFGPPIQVHVTSAPNGASATVVPNQIVPVSETDLLIKFTANSKSGRYTITVQRGPSQATIAVIQRGK